MHALLLIRIRRSKPILKRLKEAVPIAIGTAFLFSFNSATEAFQLMINDAVFQIFTDLTRNLIQLNATRFHVMKDGGKSFRIRLIDEVDESQDARNWSP